MGRHSAPDEPDAEDGSQVRAATGAAAEPTSEPAAESSGTTQPGRADWELLRSDGWLRLRCAGAVVLLFAVYTAVLVLIGRRDVYLIWLWIPIVGSGIAVGAFLDAAHRARTR